MSSQRPIKVTFITKPGCHLCDEARPVLEGAVEALKADGTALEVEEINMLDHPDLVTKFQEDIPVVLIDGKRHAFWRVDPDRFTHAINKRAARKFRSILRVKDQRKKK